jgi:hypothetical protein
MYLFIHYRGAAYLRHVSFKKYQRICSPIEHFFLIIALSLSKNDYICIVILIKPNYGQTSGTFQ